MNIKTKFAKEKVLEIYPDARISSFQYNGYFLIVNNREAFVHTRARSSVWRVAWNRIQKNLLQMLSNESR